MHMPTVVIGYTVASTGGGDLTGQFLEQARAVHGEHEAPCTLYVTGDTVRTHRGELRALAADPLFDLQMTLTRPLKTVCQVAEGQTTVWLGATLEQTEEEIRAAKGLLREQIGVECIGISDPLGCYRGLQDRPDVLEVLDAHGVRFCRTYARNATDWQPVDFSVEPFWYTHQGFAEILEFPAQGWRDAILRPIYGWGELAGYREYVMADLEETARREGQVWSYWAHDWSAIKEDPSLSVIGDLVTQARRMGVELRTQEQAYQRLRDESAASVVSDAPPDA